MPPSYISRAPVADPCNTVPVDAKRHEELKRLFASSTAGLVFVTAFPVRAGMARYFNNLAWETEVWVAALPTHLVHFDGERFLGPYS